MGFQMIKKLPINGKQKTVIKMAVGKLLIDDETYRDMLQERYGVRSCTKLTFNQASEFIKELEGKGFTLLPGKKQEKQEKATQAKRIRPPISRSDNKVVALATRDELEKIAQVAALIQWRAENGLELFLESRMKIKGGKIRTSKDAYRAIESLKKMFQNGMRKVHGDAWWTLDFSDPAFNEYIRLHRPLKWR